MEVTEKLWKSEKYQKEAHEAMKKLPNSLKSIVAVNGGPAGRSMELSMSRTWTWLIGHAKNEPLGLLTET